MFLRDVISMGSTSMEGRERKCERAEGEAKLTPGWADPTGALRLKTIRSVHYELKQPALNG